MNETVERALSHWNMDGAEYELIAARENSVFKIVHAHGNFALRLHRLGYRTDAELRSELLWMRAISEGGIGVPAPVQTGDGDVLAKVDDTQVDVLTWLPGATLTTAMENCDARGRSLLFHALGQEMARLHDISDAWSYPKEFERVAWDVNGLLGEDPLWGRFWSNPHLTLQQMDLFQRFRDVAAVELSRRCATLDYGLIHADLVPANVMVSGQALDFIDFDDGGFGFRVFEVATALLKYATQDDFPSLRAALMQGYSSIRGLNFATLDLFLAIRAVTYVGWNITRMDEDGGDARNARFIKTADALVQSYLDQNLID